MTAVAQHDNEQWHTVMNSSHYTLSHSEFILSITVFPLATSLFAPWDGGSVGPFVCPNKGIFFPLFCAGCVTRSSVSHRSNRASCCLLTVLCIEPHAPAEKEQFRWVTQPHRKAPFIVGIRSGEVVTVWKPREWSRVQFFRIRKLGKSHCVCFVALKEV